MGVCRGSLIFHFFCRCVYYGFGLIYTPVGGYGFKIRCARAIFLLGFWCFGDQVKARAKRRVVCGRTGGGCEFGGLARVACFRFFFRYVFCGFCLIFTHVGGYGFKTRCVRAVNCLGFFLLWGVSHSARKKAGYVRPHLRRLRVWGFAAGRSFSIFVVACIAVLV